MPTDKITMSAGTVKAKPKGRRSVGALSDIQQHDQFKRMGTASALGLYDAAGGWEDPLDMAAQRGRQQLGSAFGQAQGAVLGGMGRAPSGGAMAAQMRANAGAYGGQMADYEAQIAQQRYDMANQALAQQYEASKAGAAMYPSSEEQRLRFQQEADDLDNFVQQLNNANTPPDKMVVLIQQRMANMTPEGKAHAQFWIDRYSSSQLPDFWYWQKG